MKTLIVFAVYANHDTTEGRGADFFTGIAFPTKTLAVQFAKSQFYADKYGVMGTPGSDYCVRELTIQIYDSWLDVQDNYTKREEAEVRRQALAKLSDRERKVLGL